METKGQKIQQNTNNELPLFAGSMQGPKDITPAPQSYKLRSTIVKVT